MSGSTPFGFGNFIPGFDFLQQLASGAGAAQAPRPGLQNWVAPTVDVEVLEQRIGELKAVQFWLEQNLLALKATVQALEVQKMTLATLHGMNMKMPDVAKAFTLPETPQAPAGAEAEGAPPMLWPFQTVQPEAPAEEEDEAQEPEESGTEGVAGSSADPIQWWAALTQQFQQIASQSLSEAARHMPAAMESLMPAKTPAAAPRKRATARKAASKTSARPAAKKTAARKTPARKTAAKKTAAKKTARKTGSGGALGSWPLPPGSKR